MNGLELWIAEATRGLAKEPAGRVRKEIQAHYETAVASALEGGKNAAEADRVALEQLGEAKMANCQYKRVLLTTAEAKLLRDAQWEASAVCARMWMRWAMLAVPVVALVASTVMFLEDREFAARVWLAIAIAFGVLVVGAVLPVNTVSRGRVYRAFKWVCLGSAMVLAFGTNIWASASMLLTCAWPLIYVEWIRMEIRRKLRTTEWPRSLYL